MGRFKVSLQNTNFSAGDNELSTMETTMNKKTKALTTEQYKEIIQTMREGCSGCRPNERIATALVLEGNLGLLISDILKLRPRDIVS